jgi:hypothetical protein
LDAREPCDDSGGGHLLRLGLAQIVADPTESRGEGDPAEPNRWNRRAPPLETGPP